LQRVQDLVAEPVDKQFQAGVARRVGERQHRHGVRENPRRDGRERGTGPCGPLPRAQPEHAGDDEHRRDAQCEARGPSRAQRDAGIQRDEIREQRGAVAVAFGRGRAAGVEENLVQLEQCRAIGQVGEVGRELRKFLPVVPGGELVEHLAQREHIRARRAGAFGRDVAFGADKRVGVGRGRDEADVGELGHARDKDHVGGFDVPVHETAPMEARQHAREFDADAGAFAGGNPPAARAQLGERERHVAERIDVATAFRVVRDLHRIIEKARGVVPAHVQQRHLRRLAQRDLRELLQSAKLSLERLGGGETLAPHHLDRAPCARDAAREPHIAVAPAADDAHQFVIGDGRLRCGRMRGHVRSGAGRCAGHRGLNNREDDATASRNESGSRHSHPSCCCSFATSSFKRFFKRWLIT
jgi:hypothetical protein